MVLCFSWSAMLLIHCRRFATFRTNASVGMYVLLLQNQPHTDKQSILLFQIVNDMVHNVTKCVFSDCAPYAQYLHALTQGQHAF